MLLAPPPAQAPPQPTGQPAQAGADGGAGGGAAPNQLGAQAQAQAPGASGRWGGAVSWSVLSINTGITPGVRGVPGAQEHATPVKPIDGYGGGGGGWSAAKGFGCGRAFPCVCGCLGVAGWRGTSCPSAPVDKTGAALCSQRPVAMPRTDLAFVWRCSAPGDNTQLAQVRAEV